MKHIYLVRHGQTDFNLKGIVQGSGVDASINETGLKQAQAFYDNLDRYLLIKFTHQSLKERRSRLLVLLILHHTKLLAS